MATADEWRRVRESLMAAGDPMRSPLFSELYRLAREDGLRGLRKFRQIDRQDHQDLVHDVLIKALPKLLSPTTTNPRAYFLTAVRRAAIDALRRRAKTRSLEPEQLEAAVGAATNPSEIVDRQALLESESPKNQQILVAVALGESREKIARAMGTSRANVDQIVSRFRKREKGS